MAHPLYGISVTSFYSARNARIASAVLATAIPSVRPSVCLSVRPSHAGIVSKRQHVARCSLHRWMCLVLHCCAITLVIICYVMFAS